MLLSLIAYSRVMAISMLKVLFFIVISCIKIFLLASVVYGTLFDKLRHGEVAFIKLGRGSFQRKVV